MDAAQSPDGVREDEDGRYWIDLTRRQTLAGLGAAGAAALAGLGAAQFGEVIGGETSTVGGEYQVRSAALEQVGRMQSLWVAVRPEHVPDNPETPAVVYCLEGGSRIFPGPPPYGETDTIETNLAEVHVVSDHTTVTVNRGPALVVSKNAPGLQLVVDGDQHRRTAVGGNAERIHGGDTQSDLPTLGSSETPALGVTTDGTRIDV